MGVFYDCKHPLCVSYGCFGVGKEKRQRVRLVSVEGRCPEAAQKIPASRFPLSAMVSWSSPDVAFVFQSPVFACAVPCTSNDFPLLLDF